MAFGVLAGLIFNVCGTEATGSAQRFLVSEFSFMMPLLFSMLFCKRWVLITVAAIGEATVLFTVLSSGIVDPDVKGVILGSMSITLIISFVIALMMSSISETARRLETRTRNGYSGSSVRSMRA